MYSPPLLPFALRGRGGGPQRERRRRASPSAPSLPAENQDPSIQNACPTLVETHCYESSSLVHISSCNCHLFLVYDPLSRRCDIETYCVFLSDVSNSDLGLAPALYDPMLKLYLLFYTLPCISFPSTSRYFPTPFLLSSGCRHKSLCS